MPSTTARFTSTEARFTFHESPFSSKPSLSGFFWWSERPIIYDFQHVRGHPILKLATSARWRTPGSGLLNPFSSRAFVDPEILCTTFLASSSIMVLGPSMLVLPSQHMVQPSDVASVRWQPGALLRSLLYYQARSILYISATCASDIRYTRGELRAFYLLARSTYPRWLFQNTATELKMAILIFKNEVGIHSENYR